MIEVSTLKNQGLERDRIARELEIPLSEVDFYFNNMSANEKRVGRNIALIKKAIEKGAESLNEVVWATGISYRVAYELCANEGIRLEHSSLVMSKRLREDRTEIERRIKDGENLEKITKYLVRTRHLIYGRALRYVRKAKEELKNKLAGKCDEFRNIFYEHVADNFEEDSFEKLFENLRNAGISVSDRIRLRRDIAIKQGYSLGEISNLDGITRQAVSGYIIKTGRHDKWRNARQRIREKKRRSKEEREERKELVGNIAFSILGSAFRRKGFSEWAIQKARGYYLPRTNHPRTTKIEKLVELFESYKKALERGKKLSLGELSERVGIHFVNVGKIFRISGLEPLVRGRIKRLSEKEYREKEQALIECVNISSMNYTDLGHFLGTSRIFVREVLKRNNVRIPRHSLLFKLVEEKLNYRGASQIYEAEEAGFSREEISELTGFGERSIDYALKNREKIGRDIIKVLKIIYPEREIKCPYITEH